LRVSKALLSFREDKGPPDLSDVAALLQRTINHTLQLENSLQRVRTIGYLAGLYIKALDSAEFEERLTALEHVLQTRSDLP
jgi:hypothetical protein